MQFNLLFHGTVTSRLVHSTLDRAFRVRAPRSFRTRKAMAKSQTLCLKNCFIPIIWIWTDFFFIHEVPGFYTSLTLDTYELGAFKKRAPGRRVSCRVLGKNPSTLTVPLFTQVYKWVPAKLMIGGGGGWPYDGLASHPGRSRNTPCRFMLQIL